MPEMRAACTVAAVGGKTRFSTRTDSIALMVLSPDDDVFGRNCQAIHLHRTDLRGSDKSTLPPRIYNAADPSFPDCMSQEPSLASASPLRPLPALIFPSRWLQLPLYLGLIAAQAVYVVHFLLELWYLVLAAAGSSGALQHLVTSIGYKGSAEVTALNETIIMLVVLALIDVVMISNL